MKQRIGRLRITCINAHGAQSLGGRIDNLNLFAPDAAGFAGVGVEPRQGDTRIVIAKIIAKRPVHDAGRFDNAVAANRARYIFERNMD